MIEPAEIIDISPPVSPRSAVFPGDRAFSRSVSMGFDQGHHLALSEMHTTMHIGAHADAPAHFGAGAPTIEKRSLRLYYGPVQVIALKLAPGECILPRHLEGQAIRAPRVLFATGTFPDPDRWRSDFAALSPELVHWLADQGVHTVGIDTPSVDPADSKTLPAHQAILARDLANLEGLVLSHVEPGMYLLAALPLRIEGAEAAPVRAVLVR